MPDDSRYIEPYKKKEFEHDGRRSNATNMTVSFVAYIDESGDEGFKFRTSPNDQSSSDWFILATFITRKKTDIETVKVIDVVREEFKLHPRKHIHWKKLKHPQKVRYTQIIVAQRARLIAVCVHKPSLLEPEKFQDRYRLYFYAVRYLLERISWLIRDSHNPDKWGGDGKVKLVFSNRQGMSYEEMRDYFRRLNKQQEMGQDIRIDFEKVPIDKLSSHTPGKSMGLRLADATAGAFFNALEQDRYGNTEPRYIQTLAPILYRHERVINGYGFKIVPKEAMPILVAKDNLQWLSELK